MPDAHIAAFAPGELSALDHRPRKTASVARLRYVKDSQPGITRRPAGKGWQYLYKGRLITDTEELVRIRTLAIPPAWRDVWICADPDGHLQATGKDAKGRKQYRYHARWRKLRGQVKYHRLKQFGKHLPALRKRIGHDLRKHGLPKEKVVAGVVALMERTRIRVGNRSYEQDNGSYGLSTLKRRHVKADGNELRIKFKGKSGKTHDIALHDRKLVRLVMRCKELAGQDLFTYMDDDGQTHDVDSGMVNDYIEQACGADFSSKDLRTWMGTACCVEALLDMEPARNRTQGTRCINRALDLVAARLGNTRAVCKAHYVHPKVLEFFLDGVLPEAAKGVQEARGRYQLGLAEKVLLKIIG